MNPDPDDPCWQKEADELRAENQQRIEQVELVRAGQYEPLRAMVDARNELAARVGQAEAEIERLTRINNQAIERMRIAESHTVAEQERRKDAEAAAERLRAALCQILKDPDAKILDSHRDDGWSALAEGLHAAG